MKKLVSMLLIMLLGLSVMGLVSFPMVAKASAITPSVLSFDDLSLQTVTENPINTSSELVKNIEKIGSDGKVSVMATNGEKFVRIQAVNGTSYVGLKANFRGVAVKGDYKIRIVLRTGNINANEDFALQEDKNLAFRFVRGGNEIEKTQPLQDLYNQQTADLDGFKRVEFDLKTEKHCMLFWLYLYGAKDSYVDLKSVEVVSVEKDTTPSLPQQPVVDETDISFDSFEEGAISELNIDGNGFISNVNAYGTGGKTSIVKENDEKFARIIASGSGYIGLAGFFKDNQPSLTTYDIKIVLRINGANDQFKIQEGKRFAFRFYNSLSVQQEQLLSSVCDMNSTTWQTVEFELTPERAYNCFHLFMYGEKDSIIDLKSISIKKVAEDKPTDTPIDIPKEPNTSENGGCGSIIGTASVVASITLLAGAVMVFKKKD